MPKVVKKTESTPKNLRPFLFHGVDLSYKESSEQATADCPFCGREGKFSVNVDTGKWRCFVCAESGNPLMFIRKLWEASPFAEAAMDDLASNRKLLGRASLQSWGCVLSPLTGDILLPGYDGSGKLNQLYKYTKVDDGMRLLPTPEIGGHGIHFADEEEYPHETVYVCEGPWDAIALWELLHAAKRGEEGLVPTSNVTSNLLRGEGATVVAIPGCGSVGEPFKRWLRLFAGKRVVLMFDSDHPREINGKTVEPAGLGASKRAAALLATAEQPPASVEWVDWGDPHSLKSGWDVRDQLTQVNDLRGRLAYLEELLSKVHPIPGDWVSGRSGASRKNGSVEIEPVHCDSWKLLTTEWRKAMKWTDGLDRTLACMLAAAASTRVSGDQLWFMILGPASCGKSTLCEAMNVARKYVFSNSTMTGIHSGWKTDNEGKEDHSLVAKIRDKTLIIKDGDTLLQSPAKDKILSELRDLYDRVSRVHYNNGISRAHEGVDMTLLICGTSGLRNLDTSELGERFLKCTVMDGIDDDLEDEILWRKANQVERNIAVVSDGQKTSASDPDLVRAMQMTGGYVEYLRENASELLSQVAATDDQKRMCVRLGKFVSYMRARPSTKQMEAAERELAARLVTQITRLAFCMAIVLNKKTLDDDVMRRVKEVALDTARGVTLEMAGVMREYGEEGVVVRPIMTGAHLTDTRCRELLRFGKRIGMTDVTTAKVNGVPTQPRWRLSAKFQELYDQVMGE